MNGRSLPAKGHPASVHEILGKLHSLGLCSHLGDSDNESADKRGGENNLCLFDQILLFFMKEIDRREKIPPLPAVLIDGRSVDLFELYRAAREKGGYYKLSADRAWASMAEELGFDSAVASSLKLVYFLHLGALNPSLQSVLDEVMESTNCSMGGSEVKTNGVVFSSINRERKSLLGMLNWVLRVAKNPGDPSLEWRSSDEAEDRDHGVGELISKVAMARKLMFSNFSKIAPHKNDKGSLSQKRQKVHHSTHQDNNGIDANSTQKLISGCSLNGGKHYKRKLRSSSLKFIGPPKKGVPLGPSFQAEVPEWKPVPMATQISCGPDELKRLGTRITPPLRERSRTLTGKLHVGKGREVYCACESPGSVECVRFHVRQKRVQLKLKLGSAFHQMGFHLMGEDAAQSWTEEEEGRFKDVVRLNSRFRYKYLWEKICASFPSNGRRSLVSYYFNVFLVRRRGYQNRVTPFSVYSDGEGRD